MTYEKELRKKDERIVIPEGMAVNFDDTPKTMQELEALRKQLEGIPGVKRVLYRYKDVE